jgi:hypothetical protein
MNERTAKEPEVSQPYLHFIYFFKNGGYKSELSL